MKSSALALLLLLISNVHFCKSTADGSNKIANWRITNLGKNNTTIGDAAGVRSSIFIAKALEMRLAYTKSGASFVTELLESREGLIIDQHIRNNSLHEPNSSAWDYNTEVFENPIPSLSSIAPSLSSRGSEINVTLTGANFASGIVILAEDDVTVSDIRLISSDSLTARFTISSSADLGRSDIRVANPSPGGGVSENSVWFTIGPPAPKPDSTKWLQDTALLTSAWPLFEWYPVPEAAFYYLQVSNDIDFPIDDMCIECEGDNGDTFTYTYRLVGTSFHHKATLKPGLTYYWRIKTTAKYTRNDTERFVTGVWSDSYSFTVVPTPSKPELVSPARAATGVTGQVLLQWTPTSNTRNYELHVSRNPNFSDRVIETDTLESTNFKMPAFEAGSPERYYWRVRSEGIGGTSDWSDVWYFTRAALTSLGTVPEYVPMNYELNSNYPNPFNPSTSISFSLPSTNKVYLEVLTVLGQQVAILVNQTMNAGLHTVTFDARSLPSGIYLYRLTSSNFTQTRTMVLLK